MLLAVAVVALILSRFYPRVYVSTQIRVSGAGSASTHASVVRSQLILAQVVNHHPKVREMAAGDPVSWLARHIHAEAIENGVLEIRMSGFPKDREKLRQAVDAVAEEYIDFFRSTYESTSEETLALLQKAHDEVRQEDPSNTELLGKIAQRIADLKNRSPPPTAEIIKRDSGWGR